MTRLANLTLTLLALGGLGTDTHAGHRPTRPHPTLRPHTPRSCNRAPKKNWTPREVRCVTRRIFPRWSAHSATVVEKCESHFHRWDLNASGAAGPWQVIPSYHPDAPSVYDVVRITRWVERITRGGSNWSAWVCRPW